jgi:signal transduction histidine kinase
VLAAAAAMFAGLFVLDLVSTDPTDVIDVLYTVPVTLCALELGLPGGIGAAVLALVLVRVGALDSHLQMSVAATLTRGVAFLAVGGMTGRFGDRMRDAHRRQLLLLSSGLMLAHLDVADDLPALLAAQARELVSSRGARVELVDGPGAQTGEHGRDGPGDELPIEVRGVRYGTLTVSSHRTITLEDHATLAILALQAAVAAENRRLLASERERAIIRTELHDARAHLAERGRQLREVIERQEAERYQLAYQLNEQAAQSLAAILMGLAALERDLGSGVATPQLGALRSDIDSTLRSLRKLAVSLRPPLLMLGLQAAVERLAEGLEGTKFGKIEVALHTPQKLSEEAETMVYRVVEEALDAVGAARSVSVSTRADGAELVIDVEDPERPIAQRRLAVLRARMELIDGRLSAMPTALHLVIPLPATAPQDAVVR